jgi:hypothetical protein
MLLSDWCGVQSPVETVQPKNIWSNMTAVTNRRSYALALQSLLVRRVSAPVASRMERVWNERLGTCDEDGVRTLIAAAPQAVGRAPFVATSEEAAALLKLGITWPFTQRVDELMRITLLVEAASHGCDAPRSAMVMECYERGDLLERQAVLRALPLFPEPSRFLDLAVEACRSQIQSVFEAIACENPYPADQFPELNFNQMVLKALFTGIPLKRIIDLPARVTPELRRMANDYASERSAAGRSIPSDIELILKESALRSETERLLKKADNEARGEQNTGGVASGLR